MRANYIMHIDMDAFFASVEQRDNPELKGRPVAVIGANTRTVIVTCSYEARRFGVKTGMAIPQAKQLCPHITLVKASNFKYTQICAQILKILYSFTPDIEVYSIDEFFLDLHGVMHMWDDAFLIATAIKKKIAEKLSLTCSVGIAPNKLLAKLASSQSKPDGLLLIRQTQVEDVLRDLPVEGLCGIGKNTQHALNSLGIFTCGQLAKAPPQVLRCIFGIFGEKLHLMAGGIDESHVVPMGEEEKAKSIGHSMTFCRDAYSYEELSRYLLELCDKVGRRMRREGFGASSVTVVVRYSNFKTISRRKAFSVPTEDTHFIFKMASCILKKVSLKDPVRLLGVCVGKLSRAAGEGSFLFEQDKRSLRLNRMLDSINQRFGKTILTYASLFDIDYKGKVISPAWRPFGVRRY